MQDVKKVEIILDNSYIQELINILNKIEVSGFTVIKNPSGKGDRGFSSFDFDGLLQCSYILTVCTNEKQLNSLQQFLEPLLKKLGGLIVVTDAQMLVH